MCLLAMLYRSVAGFPLIVAANRDEYYDRPGSEPGFISPKVVAGRDKRAGGTWLGVNVPAGRIVGLTNVHSSIPADPRARSRGLLCMELLLADPQHDIKQQLKQQLAQSQHNPFNLLFATAGSAWIACWHDNALVVEDIKPGLCVLTNTPAFAPADARARWTWSMIKAGDSIEGIITGLERVCRSHGVLPDGSDALCVHGGKSGTLSSTIIAIGDNQPSRYLHAQGPPCRSAYKDYSFLLAKERG